MPESSKKTRANVQGEGDYEAARRYRKKLEKYIDSADIEKTARDAAPRDADEASELEEAECEGQKRAKTEDRGRRP